LNALVAGVSGELCAWAKCGVVMQRRGVLWRLERDGEQFEAVVAERDAGRLELLFLQNGELLKSLWLAAGKGLEAIEEALSQRRTMKAAGWTECAGH
jgi:hypothetical protein